MAQKDFIKRYGKEKRNCVYVRNPTRWLKNTHSPLNFPFFYSISTYMSNKSLDGVLTQKSTHKGKIYRRANTRS